MSRHPVSLKIDQAISDLERHNVPVTPEAVRVNVLKTITYADCGTTEMLDAVVGQYLTNRLKAKGYVIAEVSTHVRKRFWDCTPSELEEQLEVKTQSSLYDSNRIKADKAVIEFLREKEQELGYEPYPGLFEDAIERIYAMHSLAAPNKIAA